MNISEINGMSRQLEKMRGKYDYLRSDSKPEDRGALNNILNSLNSIEEEITNLKMNKNSNAAKLINWFRTLSAHNEDAGRAFKVKASESGFQIIICAAEAFNLNLAENEDFNPGDDDPYVDYEEYESPECWEKLNDIVNDDLFSDLLSDEHFDKLVTYESSRSGHGTVHVDFKNMKKLYKDPEVLDQVLKELSDLVWRRCLEIREKYN